MKMPKEDAIDAAIAWLLCNEGGGGEAEQCRDVAYWIGHLRDEAVLRSEARKGGVTVARLRREWARRAFSDTPLAAPK